MGYMHIDNLYKEQRILLFRECYALEKIHGTSASVTWHNGAVQFSSGGIERMRDIIAAMTEDVLREGAGEIVDSKEARVAIGKRTAETFKAKLKASLKETT